ncbi:MAG: DUF2125 domain-containing protein [Sulfitobacter sp.]|nr:DUF2125 domain-containing protein [Sulfitobacter sp.]
MSRIIPLSLGLALPVTLLAQSALADLTPAEVWSDWQQYMEGMGYDVSATEETAGGDLTISDLSLDFQTPDQPGSVSMSLGTLQLTQAPGGAVAIGLPETVPITISGSGEEGEPFTMNMTFTQTGYTTLVSGTPEEMTYRTGLPTFSLTLDELIADGTSYGAENARMLISGTGLDSTTTMTIGEARGYDQTGQLQSLTYDVYIDNPEETAKVSLQGGAQEISLTGTGMIPLSVPDMADMAAMLRAGFAATGTFTYGAGNTNMTVTDPVNGDFNAVTSSQGGSLGVEMNADALTYTVNQRMLDMTVNVADLPFPIALSMEEGGFNLTAPVTKSEEPQDFAFGLNLANFKMSDMIWGIFDPTGQLPRDPATLRVDMTGKARLDVDYLDPEGAAQMGAGGPGQIQEVSVETLLLDAAGARLEGSGDVSLDNNDMQTMPGFPKPVGQINLALQGGNALLDKLVAMGIIPDDQAMGARMMMGLFAVPGDAPDTLTSQIEFTEEGAVLANGQRIR